VRSSASSFNPQYPLVFLRSSCSCLRLLPRLPITSILASNFPSITCFRRQFLRKMWRIQLAFLLFIVCTIFLSSLTLRNTSSFLTRSVQLIFSIFHFATYTLNFPFWLLYLLVVYLKTLSVSQATWREISDHLRIKMDVEGKNPEIIWGHVPEIAWKNGGKLRETFVRIADLLTEIQKVISNTVLKTTILSLVLYGSEKNCSQTIRKEYWM
jgi:hypothetical protein